MIAVFDLLPDRAGLGADFRHERGNYDPEVRGLEGMGVARAVFSANDEHRYELHIGITPTGSNAVHDNNDRIVLSNGRSPGKIKRVAFVMLNPSTANAFKPDPTIRNVIRISARLGYDVVSIVNLFAFRSPWPEDLAKRGILERGDDGANNAIILHATATATTTIAAWGTGGVLGDRADYIRARIALQGNQLYHLGLTQGGHPKHPHARGVHRMPTDITPTLWPHARSGDTVSA